MKNILMVCLGNICRSPLAEGALAHKIHKRGLSHMVDSAGTSSYHIGEPPDSRMIQTARLHGMDISTQRARQFTAKDFDEFDLIYAMDTSNRDNILKLARDEGDREKVELLLNVGGDTENRSVPDPWYGGDEGFETVFRLVDAACEKIADNL
jgi:protein-tyrosine phosphatase